MILLSVMLIAITSGLGLWLLFERRRRGQVERLLAEARLRYDALYHQPAHAIARYRPDGSFESCNEAFERLWGLGPDGSSGAARSYNVLNDRQLERLGIMPFIRRAFAGSIEMLPACYYDPVVSTTIQEIRPQPLWVRGAAFPTRSVDGSVTEVTIVLEDVSEFKQAEEASRLQAMHDGLTGLPNRLLLADRLQIAVAQARRTRTRVGVLFLDLDFFKNVNDRFGHSTGDDLLKIVADRLSAAVREQDTVARPSGDEFIVLVTDLAHDEHAVSVAKKIMERLAEPLQLAEQELSLTASIGVALFPENGEDPEGLIKRADLAMYRAKQRGKRRVEVFTSDMDQALRHRINIEAQLRRGLERGELGLHYQPRLDLGTGRAVAVEALLRWQSHEHGLKHPGDFLDVAEESGLMVPIGRQVVQMAIQQAAEWHRQGLDRLSMAINLSETQVQDTRLISLVRAELDSSGLDPRFLELELTERSLAGLDSAAAGVVVPLSDLGARITLDSFGTGCSLLRHLKQLPVSCLKIDRSFVGGLPADPDDCALARAIICLARRLQLHVVAEGVTSPEQLDFLADFGCREIQGYLFCKPVPAESLGDLLRADHAELRRARRRHCSPWRGDRCDGFVPLEEPGSEVV